MPYSSPQKQSEYQKQYYLKNKEKKLAYWKMYRESNKEQILSKNKENRNKNIKLVRKQEQAPHRRYNMTKHVVRRRGWELKLTLEQFADITSRPCYYCQNKIGKKSLRAGGLDRIDNSKGYDFDNVISCCGACNKIRGATLSIEEMVEVAKLIIKMRNLSGLTFNKLANKWQATPKINGKPTYVGLFDTREEAIEAIKTSNEHK